MDRGRGGVLHCIVRARLRACRSDASQLPFALADALLVALVERPLLDPLRPHEPRLHEDLQMLARRRLAHAELLGDEDAAYAVLDEVPIRLRREVLLGVLEPLEHGAALFVGERADDGMEAHRLSIRQVPKYDALEPAGIQAGSTALRHHQYG